MATTTRDPHFWKRFSIAAHQQADLELAQAQKATATVTQEEVEEEPSWIVRQEAKRSRRTFICWAFWLSFLTILAVVLVASIWLTRSGMFSFGKDKADGSGGAKADN